MPGRAGAARAIQDYWRIRWARRFQLTWILMGTSMVLVSCSGAGHLVELVGLPADQFHLPAELLRQVPPDLNRDRLWLKVRGYRPVIDRY